jgi:hypothetical protein
VVEPLRSPTADRAANADGVWFNTVTRWSTSNPTNCCGERLTAHGTTTNRPPNAKPAHNSHTEKSNAKEWNTDHTSSGPNPNHGCVASNSRTTFACDTPTPFGRPVDPDV